MPITNKGYEFHIVRTTRQTRTDERGTRVRTIGAYRVYHDGRRIPGITGTVVEQKLPGDNSKTGKKYARCIAAGRYPLWTQDGTKYKTNRYNKEQGAEKDAKKRPQPGLLLKGTGQRSAILIHPGIGFMSTIGCINPTKTLPSRNRDISYAESRARVVAIIDDLKKYLDRRFPTDDGRSIPDAFVVIDEQLA